MKKVEPMRDMDFLVFSLDPSELVDYFVTPFVHAFVAYMHLRVQNPKEAEAFCGQSFNRDIDDLLIAHS